MNKRIPDWDKEWHAMRSGVGSVSERVDRVIRTVVLKGRTETAVMEDISKIASGISGLSGRSIMEGMQERYDATDGGYYNLRWVARQALLAAYSIHALDGEIK